MKNNKNDVEALEAKNIKVSIYTDIYTKKCHSHTLEEVLDTIKESEELMYSITSLRNIKNKEERNSFKRNNLALFTTSGVFSGARKSECLVEHSGMVCLDFDNIQEPEKTKQILISDEHVLSCFVSPSGNGLKLIIRIAKDKHVGSWYQLEAYYKKKYNLVVDANPKNVASGCFFSFDPNIYINWNAKQFKLDEDFNYTIGSSKKYIGGDKFLLTIVEDCISQLEASGIDITSSYKDWLDIGFAVAQAFGEEGREFFHRISNLSPKYKKEESDKQYSSCLSSIHDYGDLITIGTLFYKLKEVGIVPQTAETVETAGPLSESSFINTPLFPDEVYDLLPDLFKYLTQPFKGRARDIVLTSLLSVLSASFPNTRGTYRSKEYYCNLFTLIIAPSGSDKGRAELAKLLANKIDDYVRSSYRLEKEGDNKILKRTHLMPGNTSTADFELTLIGSQNGIIAESELDVIGNNMKQDWGNISHIFRQCFEHETIQRSRKDEDILKCDNPKLSVSLAGTFNQAPKFFNNLEDGLYNRFAIYTFSEKPEFENPFADLTNYKDLFLKGSTEIYNMYINDIKMGGSEFFLTENQKEQFVKVYKNWVDTDYLHLGSSAAGVYFRLAVQQFRIAMLLSKLRHPNDKKLICCDDDYKCSFMLIETFMAHTLSLYNRLKNNLLKLDSFYEILPSKFMTKEAIKIGNDVLGLSERTCYEKLNSYVQKFVLIKVKHGLYKKL